MPTPSLLIVPARFKSGKMYSQIPTSGAGDFTVTRATIATRVNASGLIESVASGIPRLDYFASGGTVGCPALLVEPAATNLAFNSADFTVSGTWLSGANTISANVSATLDPAGTNLADKIIPTAVSTTHFISNVQSIAIVSGTNYTVSVFAKAGGYDYLRIAFSSEFTPASNRGASFNLASGTVGDTQAGVTTKIENFGNGWYRCSISRAASVSITPSSVFFFNSQNSDSATSVTFTGDGTSGAFIWGAQLETGSVATSYIPTTTASVTRNADVISVSGAVSGSIGQTEGTIYAEVDVRNWVNLSRIFSISDGTTTNRIMTLFNTSNRFRVIVDSGGGAAQVDISSASLTNGIHKIAVGYAANDVVFYVNGALVSGDTTVNIPACNQVFLGKIETSASTNFLNDRIRAAALYTTRLTNTQLATLTTP